MNQLELLWDYQTADVAADNAKREMNRSPKRKKLLQLRDSIKEQQSFIQTLEDEKAAMLDRLVVLQDAVAMSEGQLQQFHNRVSANPAADGEQAHAYVVEMQGLLDNLNNYDREIRRIRQSAGEREHRHREVLALAVRLKNEFDQQRDEYNAEYEVNNRKVEELRRVADEKAKAIPPELLAKYNEVKEHSVPPMAKLLDDRCGGCHMTFPSGVLRQIKAGEQIRCENCGRMIIM